MHIVQSCENQHYESMEVTSKGTVSINDELFHDIPFLAPAGTAILALCGLLAYDALKGASFVLASSSILLALFCTGSVFWMVLKMYGDLEAKK